MKPSEVRRAVSATRSMVSTLGLRVDDAQLLHESNRLAVRLLPCDVLARVAPEAQQRSAAFEVEVARRLAGTDCPVAGLDQRVEPRVHMHDGFAVTLWTYHEPMGGEVAPPRYTQALERLHAGMRQIDVRAPHATDRVAEARRLVDDEALTPDLPKADRELLATTLVRLGDVGGGHHTDEHRADEQLLHGEPHPGNLLVTEKGLLFIDLETCCRGPVEFDVAHAPADVDEYYPSIDHDLLRRCRILVLAMITTWRFERDDRLPNGRQLALEWLDQLRALSE